MHFTKTENEEGQHSTMVSILASDPGCTRFDSQRSQKKFRGKIVDDAEVNQWRWLEERGQWHEKICQNHLVVVNQYNKKD